MSGGLFQRSAGRSESSVGWLVAREGTCWAADARMVSGTTTGLFDPC